ncbi:glycerophosphodiester phosphodiesterase family protein [Sphingobacterium sp. GVS05A]|uniref:glycerophosphodiester phosphodiesterase family protein n=1 Tax=Sphingobacterium sp. GVS05A TaxID=2862679 RepID=UPI001CBFA9F4|nr:glycerophosphodiester phosphodiesterase family protein [Sphingobacterium sp. GVS05A]
MKKMLFSTFLLSIIISSTTSLYAQPVDLLKRLEQKSLHIVAHRGAHLAYPENSIAAIEEAIRLGASVVELDVRATKDGVLVLMHDKTVNRTTSGEGEVGKHTYAEIQKMHLRGATDGEMSNLFIPTLQEALRICKGKIIVDLDFKEERREFVAKTYDLIAQEGMEDQVLFFLYDYKEMPGIYKRNPKITIFPRARSMKDLTAILKMKMTSIVHLDESFTDTKKLNTMRQQGIYFWMNSLGEYDDEARQEGKDIYRSFLEKYPFVRLIQTDYPNLWEEVLKGF